MQAYKKRLQKREFDVEIIHFSDGQCELATCCEAMVSIGIKTVLVVDPHDFLVSRRLQFAVENSDLKLEQLQSPGFINTREDNQSFFEGKKKWLMADFYRWQRRRFDVLMHGDQPVGGQWSFDEKNRKKIPVKAVPQIPSLEHPSTNTIYSEAKDSVSIQFKSNPGRCDLMLFPLDYAGAEHWLDTFLEQRFELFGVYEDAMVSQHNWLYHSVLTPMLNIGLLTPQKVLQRAIEHASQHKTPVNSVEGFVRQILGWREYMRASYDVFGVQMRSGNHWQHNRVMPAAFYNATTGVDPVDDVISRVLQTGYCHHIERLMVLGGFMFLCEISPDEIYQWFMEMFIDSYDWVMVPNVYAMSQHACGDKLTTKPYFSGSNYVLKMSNYKRGPWCEIWDGLFWRWVINNQERLSRNHRWSMACKNVDRMDSAKKARHLVTANAYIEHLV